MRYLAFHVYVMLSVSCFAFGYIEWQVPGFVSSVLPFYWLVLGTLLAGLVSLSVTSGTDGARRGASVVAFCIGVLLALIAFDSLVALGAYRLVIVGVALCLPSVLLRFMYKSEA
ncbi:MAG: hypothetical protein WAZ14_02425 [Patescibacteria group bacterium]